MKKRLLSMLLAVSMVLSMVSVPVMATEPEIQASGTCGSKLTWTLTTDGTLTISGTGAMSNYFYRTFPWYTHRGKIVNVVFTSGVTTIGRCAFYDCDSLTSVEIPDSVTQIGDNSFGNCDKLTSVEIPSSVTKISPMAFESCSGLTDISVSRNNNNYSSVNGVLFDKTVKRLVQYPSGKNEVLYKIPDGVTGIGADAFYNCDSLTRVVIPNSVTTIGNEAFYDCDSLISVEIPYSVAGIEDGAFASCDRLTCISVSGNNNNYSSVDGVLFDKTVKRLVQYPSGKNEESYRIPDSVTNIGYRAFYDCDGLNNVSIPSSVTRIAAETFYSCDCLAIILIPNSVSTIGQDAFYSCDSLARVVLGNGVTSIGYCAFGGCVSLSSVVIPNSVTEIGGYAFLGCDNLRGVFFDGNAPRSVSSRNSSYPSFPKKTTLYYIEGQSGWTDSNYYDAYAGTWRGYMLELWKSESTNISDEQYIIEAVKSYTTEEFFAQWSEITMSQDSNEVLLQKMTELFLLNGFLDVNEGVKYLTNTHENRVAYRMLITDEMYCAQNYFDWLHNSTKGSVSRGLLVADGLIFNFEFSEWLDLSNFAEANYPGVQKYKDMLYDYMEVESFKIEQMRYISHVTKMASKCTSAGKLYAENLIQKLNQCSTRTDLRNAMISSSEAKGFYLDIKISGINVDDFKISYEYVLDETCGFGKYAKAMGYAAKTISIANMGVNHVVDIIELDSKLEILSHYETFLQEISGAKDLPLEMRLAAQGILRELEEGAWKKVKDIAYDIFELALDANQSLIKFNIQDTVVEKALGKVGAKTVSEFMAVIGVTSFCINQIADIGSLVKGVAYVEGYVYLQNHYKQKLIDSREAFLANQTAENAWKFFEYYNVLYQLRYKGEEAYLNMSKIKGISSYFYDYGYAMKEEVVQETLFGLATRCQFGLSDEVEIPESVQYVTKAVIDCPVDVAIYAPNGTHIVTLEDGIESDLTNEHGRFAVVYRPYSGEYAKVVCFNQQGNYQIQIKGIDDGLLDFEMATTDGEKVTNYRFDHLVIQEGTVLDASTEELIEAQCYLIDQDGDGEFEEYGNISVVDSTSYSAVEELKLNQESVALSIGESCVFSVGIAPEDASRKDVIWMSSNPEVATISNGRVEAIASGEAIVYCVSQDNCEVSASCRVTVATVGIKDVCRIQKKDGVYAECTIEHLQDSANLIFAFYDSNNRFCHISQEPAVNGTTTVKIPDGAVTVSVFLLDEDWKPLTEKQSLSLEKTG